jgi:hypothetical protein
LLSSPEEINHESPRTPRRKTPAEGRPVRR